MTPFKKSALIVPTLFVLLVTAIPSKSSAIPYFARKYKTTCSRCHLAVPKLNTFGKNFQLHGYQQPGDKSVGKLEYPEDKNLTLPEQLPIAFLIENQVQLDRAAGSQSSNGLSSPTAFHIFVADSFAQDMSFFGELATEGGATDIGKVSAVFSHLGNRNLFLQVGNLDQTEHGVTEHDLYGRNGYGIHDLGLASGAVTQNPWFVSNEHMGARVYGLIGASVSPDLIHGKFAGGDDKQPTEEKAKGDDPVRPMRMQKGQKDKDMEEAETIDPMDKLSGYLWEIGVFNSLNLSTSQLSPSPTDYSARVNAYFGGDSFIGIAAYSGLMSVGSGVANRYREIGPDFSYYFGKPFEKTQGLKAKPFNLIGGYLTGQVDNPNNDGIRASFKGYYAELNYCISPKSMCFLRYDKVESDNIANLQPTITNALTANYTYYFRTNFWAGLEYTRDVSGAKQNLLGMLFNFAF